MELKPMYQAMDEKKSSIQLKEYRITYLSSISMIINIFKYQPQNKIDKQHFTIEYGSLVKKKIFKSLYL